jgi:hypothetical protein
MTEIGRPEMSLTVLGALLVIVGLVYMAGRAIWFGRMSGSRHAPPAARGDTLEPPTKSVRFFGVGENWPGMALIAIGVILLFAGAGA